MTEDSESREAKELAKKIERIEELKRIRDRELLYQGSLSHQKLIKRRESLSRSLKLLTFSLVTGLFSIIFAITFMYWEEGKYINKETFQKDLILIISNDGDLRAIKQAFLNQPKTSEIKLIFTSKSLYYPTTVALSSVLDDVRVQTFRDNKKEFLPKLEKLIKEYEEINPFDKLQVGQKDYFENIRIKTGDKYTSIRNDINNLVDELHQKNLLVNEYLSDSKMSFWISIFAVLLSLIFGGYQIFTGRAEAIRKIFIGLGDEGEDNGEKKSDKDSSEDAKKPVD